VTELATERLDLAQPHADDLHELVPIYGDPEVMRYIADGKAWSRDRIALALRRWTSYWESDGFGLFAVRRRDDARLLGSVGLLPWNPATWTPASRAAIGKSAEIEIGWTIARDAWGAGYASEAARAVHDWARDELGLRRLISLIHPDNAASIRVAEKLGERHETDVVLSGRPARVYATALSP
jgi:RimJ/RimL family protein N-acetyltransferase